jgi:signal transduction histidine kinase
VDRLKTEFVSMVSHELRTPLTSIRGSLGLLAGGALGTLPTGALRMVSLALDSCARLTRLVNDILDIERIESGTMPMVMGHHEASVLIEEAAAQLQVLAVQAGVTLQVTGAQGMVHADADRVVQTLINLMNNAIKFSPPGSSVDVSSMAHGAFVEFRIGDHGRGIPEDKLDRIFSRFEQVDSSDARDKGGSGLGLAISRSVVDRLGGRIWAESVEGAGATFRFTLPRSARDLEPVSVPLAHLPVPTKRPVLRE